MKNNIEQRIAGRAVIIRSGKVLIIRESENYLSGTQKGRYDLPGGRIEPGESLLEGLTREAKEECGLKIKIGRPFFVGEWRPVVKDKKLQIFGIYFYCSASNGKVILGPDFSDYKWIDPKDCDKYDLVPPNKEVLKMLVKNI